MGLPFVMSEKCRIFCHQKVTIKLWPRARGDLSIEWPPWQSGPRQSRRVERRTPRLVPRRQRRRWSRSASSPDFCSRRCLPRRNRHCTSHSRNFTLFTKSTSFVFRLYLLFFGFVVGLLLVSCSRKTGFQVRRAARDYSVSGWRKISTVFVQGWPKIWFVGLGTFLWKDLSGFCNPRQWLYWQSFPNLQALELCKSNHIGAGSLDPNLTGFLQLYKSQVVVKFHPAYIKEICPEAMSNILGMKVIYHFTQLKNGLI